MKVYRTYGTYSGTMYRSPTMVHPRHEHVLLSQAHVHRSDNRGVRVALTYVFAVNTAMVH